MIVIYLGDDVDLLIIRKSLMIFQYKLPIVIKKQIYMTTAVKKS